MIPREAAERIRNGGAVRVVVGTEPDDPTLIVHRDGDAIMSRAVAGWSEGVVEPVCDAQSAYLLTFLADRASLTAVEHG